MTIVSIAHYHLERARAELELAHRAEQRCAVDAHLRLSVLHMERARRASRVPASAAARLAGKVPVS